MVIYQKPTIRTNLLIFAVLLQQQAILIIINLLNYG